MLPDARRLSDTRAWLDKAGKDLRCAEIDIAATPPATEDVLYHCQQAVEKALKAFLVWHDQPFPKTHDLGVLGKAAVDLDGTLESLIEGIVELTKYAWMFRYPGDVEEPNFAEAAEAHNRARAFVASLSERLNGK